MRPLLLDAARVLAAAYLIAMMFSMGLTLGGEPTEDKHAKRRQRRLLVRALAFNLVLLPLLAVTLTHALAVSSDVVIAFLILAASPGGRFAPQLSRIAGAQLGLSVEITLFLAKLVSFTAPVTAGWMLHTHRVELREIVFIAQLVVLQLLPYVAGRQVRKRRPALAARLARPFAITMWACLFAVLALALASHELRSLAHVAGDRGWLAVVAFAVVAPTLGWLVGGPTPETRRAFAVSANARDLALALVIASLAFAERNVQVATFAVWLFLLLVDFGWAKAVGVRRQRAAALPA
jgi:BASS family bile acid:Na+ symporter